MKVQIYFLTLFLSLMMTVRLFSQNFESIDAPLIFEKSLSKKSNTNIAYKNSTTSCLADTIFYAEQKGTGIRALSVNNTTSAQEVGQRFDAPQPIIIHGVVFYGWSSSLPLVDVDVSIYAVGVDELPTGTPLITETFALDTLFGNGTLDELRREVIFASPITVSQDYVVAVANLSGNTIAIVSNDYSLGDGQNEDLSSVNLFGTWQAGSTINVGASTLNADFLFEPVVTYDLSSTFSTASPCLPSTVNFTNTSSPILEHRMYSLNAFNGVPELNYEWNFGDGSPVENVVDATHTFAGTGPFTITLTSKMEGWSSATLCTLDTTAIIGASVTDICTSSSAVVAAGGGWVDINDASNNTIVSVNAPIGVDLGTVTVEVLIGSAISTMGNADGDFIKLLPRTFHLSSSNYATDANFPSNVAVRFYFTDSDLIDMNAANAGDNGVTSHLISDIDFTHYNGMNQDCDVSNNDYSSNTSIISNPIAAAYNCSGHSLEISVSHFSEFTPHEPSSSPLPVELMSFTARIVNENAVELNWQTASETNNRGFEVEKSKDGQNWERIGNVEGHGNTTDKQEYQFNDYNPFNGINYYRLKQVDFDGSFEYTEIVNVILEQPNSLSINPNPSRGGKIFLNFKNPTTGTLNIYNTQGKLVSQQNIENALQNYKINLSELGQGIYIAELSTDNEQLTSRFIIQE